MHVCASLRMHEHICCECTSVAMAKVLITHKTEDTFLPTS